MFNIGYRAIYQKDIRSAIQEAKKNGFSVIEIHLTSPQFLVSKYSVKELKQLKYFANKQNIVLQVHAPLELSLIFTNEELRKGAKKQIEEMVMFCKSLGARCLTLHLGKSAIYNTADGKKIKDDDIYADFYSNLFEDSIKHIISIVSFDDLFICVENTDNFLHYKRVIDKYLPSGKIFLTWDIRKNYSYTTGELIEEQWKFVQKNKDYVKNLHVSGFDSTHGNLSILGNKLDRFLELFSDKNLPIIVEILPLDKAILSRDVFGSISNKFKTNFYQKTLKYWDDRSTNFLEEFKPKITSEIIKNFKNKSPKNIIEIGCGHAYYAMEIAKATGCNITCLDFSKRMIESARNKVKDKNLIEKFKFIETNIVDANLQNNYYDGAIAVSILHHLLPIDIAKACKKIYLSLKKGGKIVIVEYWTKNRLDNFEKEALRIANENRERAGFKATFFKEKDYSILLKQTGFKNIKIKHVQDKIFLNKYSTNFSDNSANLIDITIFIADK